MSKSLHEELMRLRHYSGLSEERQPKGDWAHMENWKKKQAAQAKAEAAPVAPMGTMDDAKRKMLSDAMGDVIGYRQDVDRAYREISVDNLEALVAMLKGHISPARHASLKAAVDGINLGHLTDVLDDVRIELKNMLEPPKGMKKPASKKK